MSLRDYFAAWRANRRLKRMLREQALEREERIRQLAADARQREVDACDHNFVVADTITEQDSASSSIGSYGGTYKYAVLVCTKCTYVSRTQIGFRTSTGQWIHSGGYK